MQEPNRELREDRIPESKQIKKEQEKQKNLLLLAIAGIVLALAAGLALLLSDSRGNGTSETKVDPYSSFYDYRQKKRNSIVTTSILCQISPAFLQLRPVFGINDFLGMIKTLIP